MLFPPLKVSPEEKKNYRFSPSKRVGFFRSQTSASDFEVRSHRSWKPQCQEGWSSVWGVENFPVPRALLHCLHPKKLNVHVCAFSSLFLWHFTNDPKLTIIAPWYSTSSVRSRVFSVYSLAQPDGGGRQKCLFPPYMSEPSKTDSRGMLGHKSISF